MSEDSKSFEKKLDRDFLQYLNLTRTLFRNLKDEDKQQCEIWLTHLLGKRVTTLAEKCDRNIYLSRLLLQMQNNKLTEVFLETPSDGPLPSAFETFRLPTEVDGLKGFEELGFQVDSSVGGGSGDFFESSRDGRTYLATRHLPQGVMAYIAVTNNEGEPTWVPQTCPSRPQTADSAEPEISEKQTEGYAKKLHDYVEAPLCRLRKSPEEREEVLEWMDKIISDCNKWIQGEDPHNMELEHLFKTLYEDYKQDPENSELLKHPRTVRNILFRDIRDKISERRAQVSKRELILDQYESDQFSDVRTSEEYIDNVWLEYAKKPMKESVRNALEAVYPPEVVQRFSELLYQERLLIIEKGEKQAKKRIAELRKASIEDTTKELQKLKKAKDDYKEYYYIYNDIEERVAGFEKEYKEKCAKADKVNEENMQRLKRDLEQEIQEAKRNFDKERRTQHDLQEKLEAAKENRRKVQERMLAEAAKSQCESRQLQSQKEELKSQIYNLKQRREEMKCKLTLLRNRCGKF